MSGAFDNYPHDLKLPSRLRKLKQVVSLAKADVVSFVDTFKWDKLYKTDEIKDMFGYRFAYCINLNDNRLRKIGHNNGITVLSNVEETNFQTLDLKTRRCVKTSISVNSVECDIFCVYLDDLSEDVRVSQVEQLLRYVSSDKPSIVVGDLNSFSPKDVVRTKQRIDDFLKSNRKHEKYRKQLNDMARAKVISKLFKHGFKDSAVEHKNTFPTKLTKISDEPILRVDYCLYKNCEIKEFKVLYGELFDKTSDHFPIIAKVNI